MIFTIRNRQKASLINFIPNLKKDGKVFSAIFAWIHKYSITFYKIRVPSRLEKQQNFRSCVTPVKNLVVTLRKVYLLTANIINEEEGISKSTKKSFRGSMYNYCMSINSRANEEAYEIRKEFEKYFCKGGWRSEDKIGLTLHVVILEERTNTEFVVSTEQWPLVLIEHILRICMCNIKIYGIITICFIILKLFTLEKYSASWEHVCVGLT